MDIKYLLIIIQFAIIVALLGIHDANLTLRDQLMLEHHEYHCGTKKQDPEWKLEDLYNPSASWWM